MNKEVTEYINGLKSPQKEIGKRLRGIILKTFPKIKEEMKWGVPAYDDGKFYIVGLKDHCNIGFSIRGLTKEDLELFDGGGKTTKHAQVKSLRDLDKKRIVKLLKLVNKKAK